MVGVGLAERPGRRVGKVRFVRIAVPSILRRTGRTVARVRIIVYFFLVNGFYRRDPGGGLCCLFVKVSLLLRIFFNDSIMMNG